MTSTTSPSPERPPARLDDTQPVPVGAARPAPDHTPTQSFATTGPTPPGAPAADEFAGHGGPYVPTGSTAPTGPVAEAGRAAETRRPGLNRADLAGRLWRRWLAGWGSVAHLLLNLPLGAVWLVVPILVVTGVFTIPAAGVGVLILVAALWIAAAIAWVERHRVRALLGADVRGARTDPTMVWWQRVTIDPVRWRETGGVTLQSIWGLLSGALTVWLLSTAAAVLVAPLQWGYISEHGLRVLDGALGRGTAWPEVGEITSAGGLAAAWLIALAVVLVFPLVASWMTVVDVHLARWLFGEDPSRRMRQLERRAADLDRTRTEAVDSVEAERRRIERDLHDGPQQRLVAIAMDLGMARATVHTDPDATAELLDKAHASAKDAIVEMRQVARGIVPPVLTDRGLDAALSALAARTTVPVDVAVDPRVGRLEASVEAIAYFCVSEALTNVAKHSRASRARVGVAPADDGSHRVAVTVSDDGIGGARVLAPGERPGPHFPIGGPGAPAMPASAPPQATGVPATGTGLSGLRQRVAAVDGEVHVYSPAGGPTVLTVLLPWRRAAQGTPAPYAAAPRVADPYTTPTHEGGPR